MRQARTSWPLSIMVAGLILNTVGFANLAAVLPTVMIDRGLSASEAGIAGGAFFLVYAIGSPICSALTNHVDAKVLYAAGCIFGILGGVTFPWINSSYEALVIGRVLSGLGMAAVYMPGLQLLLAASQPNRATRVSGAYGSVMSLGLSVSFAISGAAHWLFGWPAAFAAAAVAAATALLLIVTTMPRTRVEPRQQDLLAQVRDVVRAPGVSLVLVATAGNSWEGMAFRMWWIALLGFSLEATGSGAFAGFNLAILTACTGVIASPLSALVAVQAERRNRSLVIAAAAAISVATGAFLGITVAGPFVSVLALSIAYACVIFWDSGSLPPALLERVDPALRGTALAIYAGASNFAAFAAIVVVGLTLDALGGARSEFAWRGAIGIMLLGSVATTFAMIRLNAVERRTRPHP